jgi:hypothetical protein
MGDTPDTAQRLGEIRHLVDERRPEWAPTAGYYADFLLDHIDTLTARAEKAETERDALRAALLVERWGTPSPVEGGE